MAPRFVAVGDEDEGVGTGVLDGGVDGFVDGADFIDGELTEVLLGSAGDQAGHDDEEVTIEICD